MVEYQAGSMDMIQSINTKEATNGMMTMPGPLSGCAA